jgi:hypothetical protein
MTTTKALFRRCVLAGALITSACGGQSSGDQRLSDGPVGPVGTFHVDGTSQSPLDLGTTPIDSSENQGRFHVGWDADPGARYRVFLTASKDQQAGDPDDVRFASIFCDANCGQPSRVECQFSSDNTIRCQGGGASRDLTNWFDQLPQDAYIVFNLETRNTWSTEPYRVQFR